MPVQAKTLDSTMRTTRAQNLVVGTTAGILSFADDRRKKKWVARPLQLTIETPDDIAIEHEVSPGYSLIHKYHKDAINEAAIVYQKGQDGSRVVITWTSSPQGESVAEQRSSIDLESYAASAQPQMTASGP